MFLLNIINIFIIVCIGTEPKVLFTNMHELREVGTRTGEYRLIFSNLRRAVAFDYDVVSNAVFWSDTIARKIWSVIAFVDFQSVDVKILIPFYSSVVCCMQFIFNAGLLLNCNHQTNCRSSVKTW